MPRLSLAFRWSAILGALVAGEARADIPVEPVHVIYDADGQVSGRSGSPPADSQVSGGCPTASRFVDQILARTRKATIAGPSEARRTFVVSVRSRDGGTFGGRLEIRSATEATTNRDVTGPTCDAVTTALALIAALAIDPDSGRAETLPADAAAGSEREGGPPATSGATLVSATDVPPSTGPKVATSRPATGGWRWRAGALGEGNQAMAPSLAFGGAAFAELARWNDDGAPVGLSALRLGVHYAGTGTIRQAGGGATFDWGALGVEGCLVRVRLARGADASGCAAFDIGVLRAQGEEIPAPQGPIRMWLSAAPVVRVAWFVAPSWFLDAEGALVVPLRRDTFVFEDPTRVFHAVPPVGARAGVGVGYQFGDRGGGLRP